ncbi:MAG TPA: tetratricopeptide repeat protein [Sphingobium sp.]|nr:tetratricopeptide repeat protein [Sphingobium sp.]
MARYPFIAIAVAMAATGLMAANAGAVVNDGLPGDSLSDYDDAATYRDAVAAIDGGRFAQAEKLLTELVAQVPADANARFMLGKAREGLGDLPGALTAFQAATGLDAHHLRAWTETGLVQVKSGDLAAARATLATLKSQVANCGAQCANGEASVARLEAAIAGDKGAALETGHDLLFASGAAGDQAYLAAVALINQHRYEAALASLREAEAAFGPHPDILTYIGFVNRKLGRYEQAEGHYRRALAAAPAHRGAAEYYGELKVVRGDMAGARALLARLETLCSFGCAEADELRRWIDGTHIGS